LKKINLKIRKMKQILLLWLFINLSFSTIYAQNTSNDLTLSYQQLQQKERRAMLQLGTWAVGNIALGSTLAARSKNAENKAFHQMNAGWNVVNLAIAGFGYYGSQKGVPTDLTAWTLLEKNYGLQKTFLFNAGLDVGYMAGGAWLMERSKNTAKNPERLKGFGKSVVLQGGFLFMFDVAQFFVIKADNQTLRSVFEKVSLNTNGFSFQTNF
jgi:hypothetical protein